MKKLLFALLLITSLPSFSDVQTISTAGEMSSHGQFDIGSTVVKLNESCHIEFLLEGKNRIGNNAELLSYLLVNSVHTIHISDLTEHDNGKEYKPVTILMTNRNGIEETLCFQCFSK